MVQSLQGTYVSVLYKLYFSYMSNIMFDRVREKQTS